MSPRQLILRRR